MKVLLQSLVLVICLWSVSAKAESLSLVHINDRVKAIVGELSNRSAENLGNNATFGFVITSEGVVVMDSGGSYQGAKALHELIKTATQQPIKYVINTGGQDHRWFGNEYFKQLGATIISTQAAKIDQQARREQQLQSMETLIGQEVLAETNPIHADITFEKDYVLTLGETTLELYHRGQAHTAGDLFVWLPQEKVMFAGDIVYLDRMLGVGKFSNSGSWIKVFEALATFKPDTIIPGHGEPASLKAAQQSTYDYLKFLRSSVARFMDNDGMMEDLHTIDQSQFSHLANFESLSGKNIQNVYMELEFE